MLVVNDRIRVPLREFKFTFARSQGPGGQNVNKVNTKATLQWSVAANQSLPEDVRERLLRRAKNRISNEGQLAITSQRFRDRGRNVADCLAKLQKLLAEVAEPVKKRKPTRPTKASQRRRRRAKELQANKKKSRRFPASDE